MPNTIRRNGTYYRNRRIPNGVVEVAAFGLKKGGKTQDFIKYSLRTKDPREARRRVSTKDAKAEQDFEEKRQELGGAVERIGEGFHFSSHRRTRA